MTSSGVVTITSPSDFIALCDSVGTDLLNTTENNSVAPKLQSPTTPTLKYNETRALQIKVIQSWYIATASPPWKEKNATPGSVALTDVLSSQNERMQRVDRYDSPVEDLLVFVCLIYMERVCQNSGEMSIAPDEHSGRLVIWAVFLITYLLPRYLIRIFDTNPFFLAEVRFFCSF